MAQDRHLDGLRVVPGRLPEPALPAAQGQAPGGQQPRTPRGTQNWQSRVIWPLCQILAQSEFIDVRVEAILVTEVDILSGG